MARALSRAIEGWMRDVEIGLSLWNRDLKTLSEAFGMHTQLSYPSNHVHQILNLSLSMCLIYQSKGAACRVFEDASPTFICQQWTWRRQAGNNGIYIFFVNSSLVSWHTYSDMIS